MTPQDQLSSPTIQHVNTLIIGAGISGIGSAVHLLQQSPQRDFVIVEGRDQIGGTWSLFRYPGIRSDSDMSTFGYTFKPWKQNKVLADAASIRQYLQETVNEFGLASRIRFGHRVKAANWDSTQKRWQLTVETNGQHQQWTADFLIGCTGYYNYEHGYQPQFPDQSAFKGTFIHPQHWPEQLDYQGKRVVIIGSGATAITLLPAMTQHGAHVTLLQRSPTYIASVPSIDVIYSQLRKILPETTAYQLTRARNIAIQRAVYALAKSHPALVRRALLTQVRLQLRGKVPMKHFMPSYQPWDQRLCVVPDGDFFKLLRNGRAQIETDQIERFVENGIMLKSGKILQADIIVSATGLDLQMLGGISASVDGVPVQPRDHMLYRGTLISDVPNFAMILGYTNASWTLRVDIAADYICRLLNYMDQQGYQTVVPVADPQQQSSDSLMGSALTSGYVQRADQIMPRQGKTPEWQMQTSYYADRQLLRQSRFDEGVLQFERDPRKPATRGSTLKRLWQRVSSKRAGATRTVA